jgi:hypothetical protein
VPVEGKKDRKISAEQNKTKKNSNKSINKNILIGVPKVFQNVLLKSSWLARSKGEKNLNDNKGNEPPRPANVNQLQWPLHEVDM